MKVVFIGSDEFGAIGLEVLTTGRHEVALVVTVPDRPKGRGRSCEPGPVRVVAESHGIPFIQPESVKIPETAKTILDISPDIVTVVCYGEYIPESLFNAPPMKSINVHPSLLPRWRGASPVHYALLAGDPVTGVTVQYLSRRMDAGDILLQHEAAIDPDENHGLLSDRLYLMGGAMLVEALDLLENGSIQPRKQDESLVTKAPKIQKSDLLLDWAMKAEEVRNRIRAFSPIPSVRTRFRGDHCKIRAASREFRELDGSPAPGTIVARAPDGPVVACLDAGIIVTQLQPSGKKSLSGRDFINGYRPEQGERFDTELHGGDI